MAPIRHPIRTLITCLALAALASCGDDAAQDDVEEMNSASGEVLEGTISDAMLPIDEVRSRAPQAEILPEGQGAGQAAGGAASDIAAPDTDAATSQAAEPASDADPVPDLPPE